MKKVVIRRLSEEEARKRRETDRGNGSVPDPQPDQNRAWIIPLDGTKVPKQAISLRLDQDVLAFFKSQGRGYQTRINAVLRAFMNAHTGRN